MVNRIERRSYPRLAVKWPITVVSDQGEIEGEARNIAVDGIFICCDEPLPVDKVFPVSIRPRNHKPIEVAGRVVWSNLYGVDDNNITFGMGLCFVKISDEDRHFFNNVISSYLKRFPSING